MYQGYANYESWAISLWLNNEEGSYGFWTEQATDLLEQHDGDQDEAKDALADQLKESIQDNTPDVQGLYRDLLTTALERVDWYEVAETFMEEALDEYKANHEDDEADEEDL